jgi:hypothetical protein
MSRAIPWVTPRLGIAVPGSIDSGARIHLMRLSLVFDASPAMKLRRAK